MRKCPNCKKNIPVGARRCVHCRAVLSETDGAEVATSTQLGVFSNREVEQTRNNSTAFGRPGALNPIDNNSMRGMNQAFNEAPHQTMLGLATVSSSSSRSRAMEENDRLAAGNHTIAGMPGIKIDNNSRRQSFGQDSLIGASSARMNRATPVTSEPVPKSVAMNAANPSLKAPELKLEDDNPFGNLPGVAPVPSSLVDEEFVDLTAKLFGDEFAAGGSDLGDEDGWDFDMPVAPAPVAKQAEPDFDLNSTGEFNSPDILQSLLKASSIQAQQSKGELTPAETQKPAEKAEAKPAETQKTAEKAEAKPAETQKTAEKAEAKPAETQKTAEKAEAKPAETQKTAEKAEAKPAAESGPTLTMPAQLLSIVAAISSIAWVFGAQGHKLSEFKAILGFSAVALIIDILAVTLANKLSSKAVGGILAVLGIVFFVLMATTEGVTDSMKPLLIVGSIGQIVCAVIFLIRKD